MGDELFRQTIRASLIGFVVDIVVIWVVLAIFENVSIRNIFFYWIALNVVRLALWLLSLGRFWAANRFGGEEATRRGFLQLLATNRIPCPGPYDNQSNNYLNVVANDDAVDVQVRLAAASMLAAQQASAHHIGIWRTAMLYKAHDQALREYAGRFNATSAQHALN